MVYDCFTFFQELDILEIRLTELYDVVDRFILVEATHTHKGDPKPLHYALNRQRFARWNDKITHIVVGDLPGGDGPAAIWRREMTQRQCILRGLVDAKDDDVVMVSDLDEIPRREVVERIRSLPDDVVLVFDQTLFYYNVNTYCTNLRWQGTRAATAANVRALTPDGIRWASPRGDYPKVINTMQIGAAHAGWHFSYFGDVQHIQNKMTSFLHQELVNEHTTSAEHIEKMMIEGKDVWGRETDQTFEIGANHDLPTAIRTNPQRWAKYFHADYAPRFTEDWYEPNQAAYVSWLTTQAPEGACVEIGCWEGKSTVAIAQVLGHSNRTLHAVDHWRGNEDEYENHPSSIVAQERDVFSTFAHHMNTLTPDNVIIHKQSWRDWIKDWNEPIAFLHLDAAHDKRSVVECLDAIKPHLVPGAVLCGDDVYAEGVYDGVQEALGSQATELGGRLWVYQHVVAETV